ncbi:MAG: 2-hydroxyacyl-CoA dehydratase [bacterium]|nr:2-hydroxyacyl-CoA dehydratase [bacterium]
MVTSLSILKSNKEMAALIMDFLKNCERERRGEQKLVWVNNPSPTEIFYAFDVIPFMPETYSGLMEVLGFENRSLDKADSLGFSRDTCTFCNYTLGAIGFDQFPDPDLVVSTMVTSCDAQGKSFEAAARMIDVPFHLINVPSRNDRESALEFLTGELRYVIGVLEELTGTSLSREKLMTSLTRSNLAIDNFRKYLDTRKAFPPPIGGAQAFFNFFPVFNMCGDQLKVADFYRSLYEKHETINQQNTQKDEQQIRLLNAGHYFPLHDVSLLQEIEKRNAMFVSEMFATAFWNKVEFNEDDSLDELITAIARKYLKMITVGSFERRVEIIAYLAKEWQVDGIVHFLPWGCRVIGSGCHAISEYMQKEFKIPSIIIDADPLDKGIYSKGAVRTRLDAFIEMLEQKKN